MTDLCQLENDYTDNDYITLTVDGKIITLIPLDTDAENLSRQLQLAELSREIEMLGAMFEAVDEMVEKQEVEIDSIKEHVEQVVECVVEIEKNIVMVKQVLLKKRNILPSIDSRIVAVGIIATVISTPVVGWIVGINAGLATLVGSSVLTIACDKTFDRIKKIAKNYKQII
jgi:hypothetical protein